MVTTGRGIASVHQDHLFKTAFSSAFSLVALQFVSRLFTFVLNQSLFRIVSPEVFGTATIQFDLLFSTILFLSREGVRNALLRAFPQRERGSLQSTNLQSVTVSNLTILPLLFGVPLSIITTYLYGHFASYDTRNQPYFYQAIYIYALAAILELMSEPMHNRAMNEMRTGIRVRAEGLGVTSKPLVTFLLLLYDSKVWHRQGQFALMAFAMGQLTYGIVVLGVYLVHYGVVPALRVQASWTQVYGLLHFDPTFLRLSMTMTIQSIFKHVLTEGDKLILTWLSPLQDQGGYAIAVNYGSLVARIVFQPVEEVSRLFFSKMLSESPKASSSNQEATLQTLRRAAAALISLLAIQCSLSVILLVFGSSYLPIALHIILPSRYLSTSAPTVLAAWLWYIPILAVNGGLEAFLSSVATTYDLNKQSRWMAAFSVIYISAALMFYAVGFGDASLVYANMINLSARIMYCLSFITSYFRSRGAASALTWNNAVPRLEVLVVSLLSKIVIWYSEKLLNVWAIIEQDRAVVFNVYILMHVLLGGVLALICGGTWWMNRGRSVTFKMN